MAYISYISYYGIRGQNWVHGLTLKLLNVLLGVPGATLSVTV